MENESSFEYTYSAPEQEELRRLREKYTPKQERDTKIEEVRRLDSGVAVKASTASLILGIFSTLVMGVGMCCCLVWTELFVIGIIVGIIGIIGIAMAYPVYRRVYEKEKQRVAPRILQITEELMQ